MNLRIRNKATIEQLDIPKDNIEKLKKILSSNVSRMLKRDAIKKLTGVIACCLCFSYASFELRYPVKGGGATMVERYSSECIGKVFERTKPEGKEPVKLAEYYGCQMGDIHKDTPIVG